MTLGAHTSGVILCLSLCLAYLTGHTLLVQWCCSGCFLKAEPHSFMGLDHILFIQACISGHWVVLNVSVIANKAAVNTGDKYCFKAPAFPYRRSFK